MPNQLFLGGTALSLEDKQVSGSSCILDGEDFYKIENVDRMDPFFMTIVSSSDHWLFISSNGGLSAGRKNAENALFPYYSDDKITQSADRVGSKTIIRLNQGDKTFVWEPFSLSVPGHYNIERNLYKNKFGSRIIFEETNRDLKICFRYSWQFSEKYGFIKKSELVNLSKESQDIEILDGIQSIMPYGVSSMLQGVRSNLVDGYKRNVLDAASKLGVYSLSAMIVDRAEPSEALQASTAWSLGVEVKNVLLSATQLNAFKSGGELHTEEDVKGRTGCYFIESQINLPVGAESSWYLLAEINQDRAAVNDLAEAIQGDSTVLLADLTADIEATAVELEKLIGKSDGLQATADEMCTGRHVSNVLYNIMRGGIFDEDYEVEVNDFLDYLKEINVRVHQAHAGAFESGKVSSYQELIAKARQIADDDLVRISYEYLPLTFSRRHGDPSRPWNAFNIDLKKPDGTKKRSYEGNWRDIFQNWEALAYSYPQYTLGMIFKFLNATTIDGYNPYRITRSGIDWELIEPDDPWSYIGYWGDHQIIYLQKLIECAIRHDQGSFDDWMNERVFVYANVPYDIKSYADIVKDPQDTIDFNQEKQELIESRVAEIGADGKFAMVGDSLVRASFMEKILVTLLAKMSNFVPEAGIWLNTQRPEWNDANNALVGNGVSMVTLYYMRRFCDFLKETLKSSSAQDFSVHAEVAELFTSIRAVLSGSEELLSTGISDADRKIFVDQLGKAGEAYRTSAYAGFSGESNSISVDDMLSFLDAALKFIDQSIRVNKRSDGLYHAYNLLEFDGEDLKIDYLYEMLEGQVAVLSSGLLSGQESLDVLDALKASAMFRPDQYSYFLYPNRDIAHFLNKNKIPADYVAGSKLFTALKDAGNNHLVTFDAKGSCYFNGNIHNAGDVISRLDDLTDHLELVKAERSVVLDLFEEMFDHKSYTGRSGTFFAFEGLGSIYWHMVSKLLVAAQESIYRNADVLSEEEKGKLIQHYYEIRAGIGINKNPSLYGAFPTDPYSHTPYHKGAQQPGMTGQVKEDVLNRWAELGVVVNEGKIAFEPIFLNTSEFFSESSTFRYFRLDGSKASLDVTADQLAFTYCQVPVIYENGGGAARLEVEMTDGSLVTIDSNQLPAELSAKLFNRTSEVFKIKLISSFA